MPFEPGHPKLGGRKPGTPGKRTQEIQEFARGIVEHPKVRERTLKQAIAGELPAPMMQLLYYYAYGKPIERLEHTGRDGAPLAAPVTVITTLTEALQRAYLDADPGALDAGRSGAVN